jgi:3-dehydroquinate synthetase
MIKYNLPILPKTIKIYDIAYFNEIFRKLCNNAQLENSYDCIIEKGIDLIQKTNINFDPKWFDFDSLMETVKSDKKSTGKLTMVLVDNKPFLADVEEVIILEEILKHTYESI